MSSLLDPCTADGSFSVSL
uniref:Uncharacterized protein n=1 Tax=Rhizophora mucronata TaxID=61149 RepID=A0A2P2PJX8_RHIMU